MKKLLCGLALAGWLVLAPVCPAADDKDDLNSLSMEVAALQQLHDLKVTPTQLEELARLVKTTAGKMPDRKAPKVEDKVRKAFVELREALLGDDDDAINEKSADVDTLKETEKVEVEDEFELTDEARKQAAAVLRRLSPRQVAGYLVNFADEFPEPLEKLTDALMSSQELNADDWTTTRDEVAGQVGWLIGGIDKAAEEKVKKKVLELLNRARKLKPADFTRQRKDLEKEARELADEVGPTEVVRNFLLRTVAELLSNPRSAAALNARIKKLK